MPGPVPVLVLVLPGPCGWGRTPPSKPPRGVTACPRGGPPSRSGCDIDVPVGVGGRGPRPPRCESQRIKGAAGNGLTRSAGEEGVNQSLTTTVSFCDPPTPPPPLWGEKRVLREWLTSPTGSQCVDPEPARKELIPVPN